MLAWAGRGPLNGREIGQLRHLAGQLKARLLVLPLTGGAAEVVTRPEALVRTALAAAGSLPADTRVIPVPLAPRGREASGGERQPRELAIRARIAASYGATHLMVDPAAVADLTPEGGSYQLPGAPIGLVPAGDWAYDPRAEVWRPAGAHRGRHRAAGPVRRPAGRPAGRRGDGARLVHPGAGRA